LSFSACGGGGGGNAGGGVGEPADPNGNPADPLSKSAAILPLPLTSDLLEEVPDLEVIDLNGDGLNDVLMSVANKDLGLASLRAMINQGNRSFLDKTEQLFPADKNPSVANLPLWISNFFIADLNNDGLGDIIANTNDPEIPGLNRVFIHQVDHSYFEEPLSTFPVLTAPGIKGRAGGVLIPIDTDNDGDLDLVTVVAEGGWQYFSVYLNTTINNVLSFELSNTAPLLLTSPDKAAFIDKPLVMDINHDGFQDIVYAGPKWKDGFVNEQVPLVTLINDGKNGFNGDAASLFSNEVPALIHGGSPVAGDFNGDGVDDVFIGGSGFDAHPFSGERNILLLSQPDGQYTDSKKDVPAFIDNPHMTHGVASGDLDGDGDLDIVLTDLFVEKSWESLKVLINDGSGNFQILKDRFPNAALYGDSGLEFGGIWSKGLLNSWTSIRISDMDGDGRADIILGAMNSGTDSIIYWNAGTGFFL